MDIKINHNVMGIYIIENLTNKEIYIGSSKNIHNRLQKHMSLLRHNKHENRYLQNSFNKYKEVNFKWYIAEVIFDINTLTTREQLWIDLLNPGYNITKEVIRNVPSKESRLKISNTLKFKYSINEIEPTKITKVNIYDLNGMYLNTYSSQRLCAKELNISYKTLNKVLRYKYKRHKEYQFRYYTGSINNIDPYIKTRKKIIVKIPSKFVPIDVFTREGVFIKTYFKQRDCAKELNISTVSITNCLSGKFKFCKNFMIKKSSISKEEYLTFIKNNAV